MPNRRTAGPAAIGAVLLATALVAGCSGSSGSGGSSSNDAKGGTGGGSGVLNIGMPNGAQSNNSNPFLGTSAGASLGYRSMIYEPLAMTNAIQPQAKPKPWLATKWAWSDNYKKLVLTIRQGVKWSDGKPFTAQDVAYTFDLMKKNTALNAHAIQFGTIAASGNTVTLTFAKSQFVQQSNILMSFIVPQHIWSKIKNPTTWTDQNPVGTGPYVLKGSVTSQGVTLVRRSGYWQKAPAVKELRYTSYTGNDTQTTALASGACEWSYVFMPNYKNLYIKKDPKDNHLWFPSGLGIHGLWLNTAKAPLNNVALRQAINDVVDRHAIFVQGESSLYPEITSVTGLPSPAGDSYVAPEYKGVTDKPDLAKAKQTLTKAGYTLSGGVLKDPKGNPVKITLSDPSGWSDYLTDLSIIKNELKQIGVQATVKTQTADAWTTAVNNGQFDAVMHWTNTGATPYDMYENVMDGKLLQPIGKGSPAGNFGRFKDPKATQALEDYADATTDAQRTTALNTIEHEFVTQVPVVATSAGPIGAEYNTKHWVGWPTASNPYAPPQPTQQNALDIVLHLKPAS